MKIGLLFVVLGLALVPVGCGGDDNESLREIDREKELQAALEDADSCDELSGS